MPAQFKTFSANAVLTASDVNAYLMKQAVIVADSSADYPSSPNEGMVVYDKNLDSLVIYDGSNWIQSVPVAGAADLTWTPAVVQSAAVAATVTEARYVRQGPLVTAWADLSVTGTGSAGAKITVSTPTNITTGAGQIIGTATVFDAAPSTVNYTCAVQVDSSTTVIFKNDASQNAGVGVLPSFALASGDVIRLTVQYLAA